MYVYVFDIVLCDAVCLFDVQWSDSQPVCNQQLYDETFGLSAQVREHAFLEGHVIVPDVQYRTAIILPSKWRDSCQTDDKNRHLTASECIREGRNDKKYVYWPQVRNNPDWPVDGERTVRGVLDCCRCIWRERGKDTRCRSLWTQGSDSQSLERQIPVFHICSIEPHLVWSPRRFQSHRYESDHCLGPPWGYYLAEGGGVGGEISFEKWGKILKTEHFGDGRIPTLISRCMMLTWWR